MGPGVLYDYIIIVEYRESTIRGECRGADGSQIAGDVWSV